MEFEPCPEPPTPNFILIRPRYVVLVDRVPSQAQVSRLNGKMSLDGVELRRMSVTASSENPSSLEFRLREGRKHQIRRCCNKVGLEVIDLFRVEIGPWTVGGLAEGEWRLLSPQEVELL